MTFAAMRFFIVGIIASILGATTAQRIFGTPTPKVENALTERLFPELIQFWKASNFTWPKEALSSMQQLAADRKNRIQQNARCDPLPLCIVQALNMTSEDEAKITEAFHVAHAPQSLLDIWPRYVESIRYMFAVYGNGTASRSEEDSMLYNPKKADWEYYITGYADYLGSKYSGFVLPPFDYIQTAMTLLDVNDRTNAVWFKDLWQQQNAGALALSHHIQWDNYKYSAILVPGMGPELTDEPLSPQSKMRLNIAVQLFYEGQAPYIVVSGGAVHPAHTPYTEAYNLRQWLVEELGFPSERVVMEPHSRHTTTNYRNTARELDVLGAPHEKPILTVTNSDQFDYILKLNKHRKPKDGVVYAGQRDLGYTIGKVGPSHGKFLIEFRPNWDKIFTIDPMDPLDP